MGVYRGLDRAAHHLGWRLILQDGEGRQEALAKLLADAVVARPDAIVFGGFQSDAFAPQVAAARRAGIVLVGWHAAAGPGPTSDLFANVATDSAEVARAAARFVIEDARARGRKVGVVLFNDSHFAVANAKTARLKETVEACQGYTGCKVLAIEDLSISDAEKGIERAVRRLLAAYGAEWTYTLAINDVYFDGIHFPLISAGRRDILHVSAGDGSQKALGRIESGFSQQIASVAEPLGMQGWQLADELNRAFAGAPPSGLRSAPILVTAGLLKASGARGIEADLEFEAAYSAVWKR